MSCILSIDSGLTVTKAVVFDEVGKPLSVVRRRLAQIITKPHHIERDMGDLWSVTTQAIAEAIQLSGRQVKEIIAVVATAHGDGVYLLDSANRPLGNAILSLDSRAADVVARWESDGTSNLALVRTGQKPHVSAPSALLAWIKAHEFHRYTRIGHVLACKDWLRFCLSGDIGTDLTESSTSFSAVDTQHYALDILKIFGLDELASALPPVAKPETIVGYITLQAAQRTGLAIGTPVVAGLHDVTASALGIGGYAEGTVAIVAGTYSINETISTKPNVNARWLCRNGISHGQWNNMAISPASASNYDWFLDTLCGMDRQTAETFDQSIHSIVGQEIEKAMKRQTGLLFHPYLYGSPHGAEASASFIGLRAWHNRGDMLRAVIEGVAFNHRFHVEALRDGFDLRDVKLTGGISRNPLFAQIFANALCMPIVVTATEEAAA